MSTFLKTLDKYKFCKRWVSSLRRFSINSDEIVIEVEGDDIHTLISGYLDQELECDEEYFVVSDSGNYVTKDHEEVTDDQREGLISYLCTEFGYIIEGDMKVPLGHIYIHYPPEFTLEDIHVIDKRLKEQGYAFHNWRVFA